MPEVCRRNDRPTERWVSARGAVVESLTRRFMTRRLTPRARSNLSIVRHPRVSASSRRCSTPNRPLFVPARARVKIYTRPVMTHHRVPSVVHPPRAREWKVRQFGTTRARASRGRGEAREARRARGLFFCSFAVRSPIVRRSDGNRRARSFVGDRARGRAEPRSRRLSVVRAIGRGTARCGR